MDWQYRLPCTFTNSNAAFLPNSTYPNNLVESGVPSRPNRPGKPTYLFSNPSEASRGRFRLHPYLHLPFPASNFHFWPMKLQGPLAMATSNGVSLDLADLVKLRGPLNFDFSWLNLLPTDSLHCWICDSLYWICDSLYCWIEISMPWNLQDFYIAGLKSKFSLYYHYCSLVYCMLCNTFIQWIAGWNQLGLNPFNVPINCRMQSVRIKPVGNNQLVIPNKKKGWS